jgi:3-hydroxyisobutyrate dehydrogenase-like beta-hydroxyacid dehydrogenase
MAERLLTGEYEVTVYNRSREKAEPLAAKGARIAGSAREAIAAGEATVFMVRDGAAVRELLAEGGSFPDLTGKTVIQMSTIAPTESEALAADVRQAGGDYLEAPVLGSVPQATDGSLKVIGGGAPESFARWSGLLRRFGPDPRLVGPVGHASTLKLALNQLIGSVAVAQSLSLGLVRRKGLDVDIYLDMLRKSPLHSATFDRKLPQILARDFSSANFPAALLLKDLDLVRAEAATLGLDITALEGVRAVVGRTVEAGRGREDYAALYEVIDPETA